MADLVVKIANDLDELSVAADAATRFLERNKASSDVIFAANLAVDEIVTNIIKYGYEDSLTHEIIVRLTLVEGSLEIETCDDGKAFNPFSQPEPDASGAAQRSRRTRHPPRSQYARCLRLRSARWAQHCEAHQKVVKKYPGRSKTPHIVGTALTTDLGNAIAL